MDRCEIHNNSIVAAGAVVLGGTVVEAGFSYASIPAKNKRYFAGLRYTVKLNRLQQLYKIYIVV